MSFSGSSLLGFIIGCTQNIWNLGELKVFTRKHKLNRICTCKSPTLECSFWSKYYEKKHSAYNQPSLFVKLLRIIQILLSIPFKKNVINNTDDYLLLTDIDNDFSKHNISHKYYVDTSKSLWRLIHLVKSKNIHVDVIYLKRGAKENLASFVKHGNSFFKSFFMYWLMHLLCPVFLKRNNIKNIEISHELLCNDPDTVLNQIGGFLGIDYSNYKNDLTNRKYHIRTGNPYTVDQFRDGFKGFKYDDSWKSILSSRQIKLLSFYDK